MSLLDDLNPQQRQAVSAPPGPTLVLAGPGSGKTRVLTYRVVYLLSELSVPSAEIMAVTFTNKAAREMAKRIQMVLAGPGAADSPAWRRLSLGTFHALSARMLRREADLLPFSRDFVIYDENDQGALIRQALKDLNLDLKQYTPGRVLAAISSAKNELIGPSEYAATTYFAEVIKRVYEVYQKQLISNNALDFDDLLMMSVALLRDHDDVRRRYRDRYRHILVDEFQDTNTAQYILLRLLAGDAEPDLFVVGDADQSIYRWRGADYRNVLRFQEDYPSSRMILLEQNYRSTQTILDAAMAVIDRHPARQVKRLFTDRGRGAHVVVHEAYDEQDEAAYVVDTIAMLTMHGEADPGDCAVMYRTNAQSRSLEEAFLRAGLPYRLVGAQRFYGRREVKDLIAYLRLIHNPLDQVSLLRVLNVPPRGLGAKSVQALLQTAASAGTSPSALILDQAGDGDSPLATSLGSRPARAVKAFGEALQSWIDERDHLPLTALIDRVLAETDYRSYIDDGTDEGADRWANVMELRGVAQEMEDLDLTSFLEHVALISDQDTLTDSMNVPTLLTLHAAKGLEFPVVFIIGLDEGVLPHQRALEDSEELAEERRLFYVGLTRAKDRLFLVRTFRRRAAGISSMGEPSRFLLDIPADLVEGDHSGVLTAAQASFQRQTRWESSTTAPATTRYRVGMHIRHPKFGEGIVMSSRLDGDDEEVTITFASQGVKRLAASLAKLDIVDDEDEA
jgi:DNA helicase-2/ATP-dependent DNA helicase PcrA